MPFTRYSVVVGASLVILAQALAGAQSLAEIARRAAERRKAVEGEAKVYTNKDLADVPSRPAAPPAAPAASQEASSGGDAAAAAPGTSSAAEEPVRDQAYWANRMDSLLETLARNETYLEALQSRINALTTDFVNRDDPAQRAVIAADRERAVAELERLKSEIQSGREAIADLREEARRNSVPPGWLR